MQAARCSSRRRASARLSNRPWGPSRRSPSAAGPSPRPPRESRWRPRDRATSQPSWRARRAASGRRSMANRVPPEIEIPVQASSNLRVLKLPQAAPRPNREAPPERKPWDSFFTWMLLGSLLVALPFFLLGAFFNLAQWGLLVELGAAVVLIGLLALASWWISRPVAARARAANAVESGDFSSRAVPGGGGDTWRLAMTFNMLLDRLLMDAPDRRSGGDHRGPESLGAGERLP